MYSAKIALTAAALLGLSGLANADVISAQEYDDDEKFASLTGAETLTGELPDNGPVGNPVTLGDATLTAGNTIYVGNQYSKDRNAIAISGDEDLDIVINVDKDSNAFGFYFKEPTTTDRSGCNVKAGCVDSTFTITFLYGGTVVGDTTFDPADDKWLFYGIILDEAFNQVVFTEEGGIDNEFYGEMFIASVPEPGTLALLGMGLVGIGIARRRRQF